MTPLRITLSLGALVLLFTLSLSGCDEVMLEQVETSACSAALDCGGDLECSYGYCVAPLVEELSFMARLTMPPGSSFVQQQLPELVLQEASALTIQLVESVELSGVIHNDGDAFVSNLAGELEARATGEIEGMDYRFTARSSDGLDSGGVGYSLRLLPGRDYTLMFRPDDKALPPHSFEVQAEDLVSGTFDLVLPPINDYVKLAGWVQWPSGKPVSACKMTVLLEGGQALPTLTLDTPQSAFDLRLPPDTTSFRVRIESSDEGALFPTFVTSPMTPSDDVEIVLPSPPAGGDALDAQIRVQRLDGEGVEVPATGVNLVLSGTLPEGHISATAMTNDDGLAIVRLLPGTYDVVVASPPGHDFGTLEATLTWSDLEDPKAHEEQSLLMPKRPLLKGSVRDASGKQLTSGQVHARLRPNAEATSSVSLGSAPFIAQIDAKGDYEMHVDAGIYDITVIPDASSGAPSMRQEAHEVHDSTTNDIALPAPT